MRWTDRDDARLPPEEIVVLVRQIASPDSTDTATNTAVYRLESHVRQIVREQVALAAEPSEKIAAAVSKELSKLTTEVERGLHSMSLAIWRKR